MFLKPFRIKSKTQLKTSDKKKIKVDISKNFPAITEDQLNSIVNIKDEITQMKIETAENKICNVVLAGQKPILFIYEDKMYPTVFLLWQAPNIMSSFSTFQDVLPRLMNGADLMLPGIVVDQSLANKAYGKLAKGTPVSVNTVDNIAPIAVGRTALSSEDMYMSAKKGKGVEILHCMGDTLFQHGGKAVRPKLGAPVIIQPTKSEGEAQSSDQVEGSYAAALTKKVEDVRLEEKVQEEQPTEGQGDETENDGNDEASLSPQEEMDLLLTKCFLKALRTTAKKLELPCLTNVFYANHILPACPKSKTLDIKKTSFKKLSKFLAHMQTEGVLEVKEQQKGVESMMSVNHLHDLVRRFKDDFEAEEDESVDEDDDRYEAPAVTDMYCVTAAVLPVFRAAGHEKGAALTCAQVKLGLTDYIKKKELQHPEQKSVIRLDPALSDALLEKSEKNDNPALTWERLMQRCLNKMTKAYSIRFPGQDPVLKKGELKPIEMNVMTRSGNKKVTLVSGLDTFEINMTEFAHKCQVGVAASTTIVTSPDKKGSQVLIQGNQVAFVTKLLFEEYKLQRKYVKGAEGALSKGKKK